MLQDLIQSVYQQKVNWRTVGNAQVIEEASARNLALGNPER
jgi:hypothetical protein